MPSDYMAGLPRLAEARFTGAYPLAHLAFDDAALPITVELEAFNPFIPLNADDSGLPVAIFRWRLHNPLAVPVDATIALSLLNAAGYDGQGTLSGRKHGTFGGNLNEWVQEEGLAGLRMTGKATEGPGAGSLAIASPWPATTFLLHWERAGWFDSLQNFWDTFKASGRLPDDAAAPPSPDGETDVGTLGLCASLAPGASGRTAVHPGLALPQPHQLLEPRARGNR